MAVNIVSDVIDASDLNAIKNIAQKYDMTLVEFGRLLGKSKNEKGVRFQIRFTIEESKKIDSLCERYHMARSKYCLMACRKYLENEKYKKINILDVMESRENREMKVCVSFQHAEDYNKIRSIAKSLSVPFTTLIRYFALNADLSV